jgi:opacity protein-like surface antigen
MNRFSRIIEIRKSTAVFVVLAAFSLMLGAGIAMADEIGGEDIAVPPPAAAPAPAPPPVQEDRFKLYLTGIVGYSWAKGEADGDARCFVCDEVVIISGKNSGDDWDNTVFGGGALGFDADLGPVGLRVEWEGQGGRNYDMDTDGPSFTIPVVTIPELELAVIESDYDIDIGTWAMFWNVFLDVPITDAFDLYLGGGVGFGVHDFRVRLGNGPLSVSETKDDELNFAWQVGTGMAYDVADWLTLDLGYRYVDFGQLDVDMSSLLLKSDYEMDLTSHDLILGVRINYYAF